PRRRLELEHERRLWRGGVEDPRPRRMASTPRDAPPSSRSSRPTPPGSACPPARWACWAAPTGSGGSTALRRFEGASRLTRRDARTGRVLPLAQVRGEDAAQRVVGPVDEGGEGLEVDAALWRM